MSIEFPSRKLPKSSVSQVSRREALRAALLTGSGVALWRTGWAATVAATGPAPGVAADPTARALITKAIPSTGEKLPAIGLGTDKFSTGARQAIQAEIKRMQELGGTVIDTAAAYGDSETLIGEALAADNIRGGMFLATKLTASGRGYGADGVSGQASFERSLARLKTQRVDLLQIHNLDGVDVLLPQLQKWKEAGKIRYFGITTSQVGQHGRMIEFMHKYPLDFIQVDYSLDNRDAAATLLPLAMERRMAVLANVPFGFGSTLRDAQKRKLPGWARDFDIATWGQFLLKYVISHPAVTCAIPGSTKVEHLEDNQQAARGRLPDEGTRRKMEQFWDSP